MAHAVETLEHAKHIAHAGDGTHNSLSMCVGITMATLGVLLAAAAAKVGGERTELVKALVEQQHAHSKYQAQDIKHRVAVLSLQQTHAFRQSDKLNGPDMLALVSSIDRYHVESVAARAWVEAYDPAIRAHTLAQEEYELTQLAAEFGIVLASIALLLRRRLPWLLAIGLGGLGVFEMYATYAHVRRVVRQSESTIEERAKTYLDLREEGKTDVADQALVDEVRAEFTAKPVAPAAAKSNRDLLAPF